MNDKPVILAPLAPGIPHADTTPHNLIPYEDDSPERLLALALRNLGARLDKLEVEQKALDENVVHIASALEAIIEAATASLEMKP